MLTMLVALAFVLARNIVKLVVERRRGLPFSRFRAKLVLALLGLTIVPSVLVLLVGERADSQQHARWFSRAGRRGADIGARTIASDYYANAKCRCAGHAARIARELPRRGASRGRSRRDPARGRPGTCAKDGSRWSRFIASQPGADPSRDRRRRVAGSGSSREPRGLADRLAARSRRAAAIAGTRAARAVGELVRAGVLVRDASGAPRRRRHRQRPAGRRPGAATPGGSPRPTRATASCACCDGRSRASTCRCS